MGRAARGLSILLVSGLLMTGTAGMTFAEEIPAETEAVVETETAAAEAVIEGAASEEMSAEEATADDEAAPAPEVLQAAADAVLSDNVLSYDELQQAIHNGNPNYQEMVRSLNARIEAYQRAEDQLRFARVDSYSSGKDKKKEDKEEAMELLMEAKVYQSSANMYHKMIENMTSWSSMRSYRQTERRLTAAAQSLMISVVSLRHQKETLAKAAELSEKQLQLAELRKTAGLASDTDVISAESSVYNAKVQLAETEERYQSSYESLCAMVGREPDGSLRIDEIPAPDLSRIDRIDLSVDIPKAIGNNTTLISQRHSNRGKSTQAVNYRMRTNENGDEQLSIRMQELYDDVIAKRDALNAAETAYQKGELEWKNAELKKSAGMLSEADYLSAERAHLSAVASYQAAQLAMTQALDTYDWAVAGQAVF